MKAIAIIQARMGSSRLPGKVLMKLGNKSVLARVIERVSAASELDQIIVATTVLEQDDAVSDEAKDLGVAVFRGDEQDVLSRYYHAAKQCQSDLVVRITSDCPLYDGALLDKMLVEAKQLLITEKRFDYMSNTIERTYPQGLDTEIFTLAALEKAHHAATSPYDREHVTPYIYKNSPELFRVKNFSNEIDLSSHRWTLDTAEDYEYISGIYDLFSDYSTIFSTESIIQRIDNKELT